MGDAWLTVQAVSVMLALGTGNKKVLVPSIPLTGWGAQAALESIRSALPSVFLGWIEGKACVSHARKWFTMTHDAPAVIPPLLIAVGASKCVFLLQMHLAGTGITQICTFHLGNPCNPKAKATQGMALCHNTCTSPAV